MRIGEANKGFRRIDYSKERRVDRRIIVSILVDRAGSRLEVEAFESNKVEPCRLLPVMLPLQACHGVHNFVEVADAG